MENGIPNCLDNPPFYTRCTRRAFEGFARLVFRYYCPLEVIGVENLPRRPYILCSNHSSHMDGIALMAASRQSFDRFGLLAASDYFFRSRFVYRCFASMVQLIPISRKANPETLRHTIALCRRFIEADGRNLILFPEGTRSRNGKIGAFKSGMGMLATKLGLPIVPAYIQGAGEAMPTGRFFPGPGRVTVRIGIPIFPGANGDYESLVSEARSSIDAIRGGPGKDCGGH